jgi:hypothetical protein
VERRRLRNCRRGPAATGGGNFWHWGAWTYNLRGAYDGTLGASYSAFAVRLGAIDTNMVVHVAPDWTRAADRASSTGPWAAPRSGQELALAFVR